jgi:hypothetical protein
VKSMCISQSEECKGALLIDEQPRLINLPLAEKDILFLQDAFLKNETHNLIFSSFKNSRQITTSILESLSCHKNIAYMSEEQFLEGGFDIVAYVKNNNLQDLFLDNFYFDFLYIERSFAIVNSPWFEQFENYLKSYSFDKTLPIIQVEIK